MYKKRWISKLGVFLVLILAAGCAENPEKNEMKNQLSDYKESETYVTGKLGERIIIDAEVQSRPKENEYEMIHCTTDITDNRELYKKVFFKGEDENKIVGWDVGKTYEDGSFFITWADFFNDGTLEYDQNGDPWSSRFWSGYPNNEFSYTDNYEENIIRTGLFFSIYSESENLINERSMWDWEISPESLKIEDAAELEDYSKKEAIADTKTLLDSLKMNVCEKPTVIYAIKREDWSELYTEAIQWFKNEIREETEQNLKEDAFYYMIWLDELNGIPIVTGNRSASAQGAKGIRDYPEDGVYNIVFAKKNKVLYFNRSSAKYTESGREEKKPIISLQEAIERLDEHYGKILMETDHTLYRVNFCYVPDKTGEEETKILLSDGEEHGYMVYDVDMIPAWCLEVEYQGRIDDPNDIWHEMIYINAQTGEVIQ